MKDMGDMVDIGGHVNFFRDMGIPGDKKITTIILVKTIILVLENNIYNININISKSLLVTCTFVQAAPELPGRTSRAHRRSTTVCSYLT